MRDDIYMQMYCVSESNGKIFEMKMNEILLTVRNPKIEIDKTKPFTAYIFYKITQDIPETVEEAFSLVEKQKHHCTECPHFERNKDKRRRWHWCLYHKKKIHQDNTVCETFYQERTSEALVKNIKEAIKQLP